MRETPETDRTNIQPEPPARIDKLIAELCPDGVDAGYIKGSVRPELTYR